MKFSDGYWLNKKGYDVTFAAQAYEVHTGPDFLKVIATGSFIHNRGQTLGGPIFEIVFSSALENIIDVKITHYTGTIEKKPVFDLCKNFSPVIVIEETEDYAKLTSGKTSVTVQKKGGWNISYAYGKKPLTNCIWRTTSVINESAHMREMRFSQNDEKYFWDISTEQSSTIIREQLGLAVGECIYGFGEKFTTFVKNGQTVDVWNADGGTCSEQSYKSIPFYVSSKGYGVFVNNPGKVSFEIASETVSKVSFSAYGQELEYSVIGGDNILGVLENYTNLTGKPALPPPESFGLWLTTSFTTKYDEETITSFIDGMAERNIPLQVFHFDCFWMREFRWCDFEWDTRQFLDPPAMLARLKEKGLKICVWINPYIAQLSPLFKEGEKKEYFIKNKDGSVFQCDMWQPGMALVDFTNPDACKWYAGKLKKLCDMGVDYFKTDFGERVPTDVVYFDGSDPMRMHNYYSYLYNKTVFDLLIKEYGENQACLFARSATAGGQKFPVHWGGDCSATYESMAETLRGGLSLCLSGFGYFSHDISGFESTASPDIYKRWSAFGLLSSHSRLHGNSSYRVPWLFDEESVNVLRHFTNLKGKLMPYLFSNAVKCSQKGIPMMKAMVAQFAEDPVCLYLDRQYMFGDALLVAPIFNTDGIAEFYVPEGVWTDIQSGEEFTGGKYYRTKHDYFSLPLLAKPGSIIPFGNFKEDFNYDYLEGTEFKVYRLSDGESVSCDLYDAKAKKIFDLTITRCGDEFKVDHTPVKCNFKVTYKGKEIYKA